MSSVCVWVAETGSSVNAWRKRTVQSYAASVPGEKNKVVSMAGTIKTSEILEMFIRHLQALKRDAEKLQSGIEQLESGIVKVRDIAAGKEKAGGVTV